MFSNFHTIIRSLASPNYLLHVIQQHYSFEVTNCKTIKFVGSNDIFLLSNNTQKFIMKIFFKRQCWDYNAQHYLFELELQKFLNIHRIQCPKPVEDKNNNILNVIDLPEGKRYYAIYEFVDGTKYNHSNIFIDRFTTLAKTIKKIHNLHDEFLELNSYKRILDIKKLLHESWENISLEITLPNNKIKKEIDNIYNELAETSKKYIPYQKLSLIHGDVHCGNHFYQNNVIKLIDFELSGYGYINYELSVLKYDLIKNNHEKSFIDKIMNVYLEAYFGESNKIDIDSINFFVKVRYFFMLGSTFLFYPDKSEYNNEFTLNYYINSIKNSENYF
jgi:Ser/Thr protein kinase RdoA (MazF antagonist)